MAIIAFFASPLGRWLVIAALVAAACGYTYHLGVEREGDRRDAQALAAVNAGIERHLTAVKVGQAAVRTEQSAAARARAYARKLQGEINATPSPLLAGCTNTAAVDTQPLSGAAPPGGAPMASGGVFFSDRFVRLWDAAWTGADGQPVFGDPPGAAPAPGRADPARSGARATPDAGAVLSNHAANAEDCSADRRRLSRLIDVIEQLERDWDNAKMP